MPELKELHVEFISLVRRPANRKKLVLKGVVGGGGTVREFPLIKADGHLRRVYGIVYAPDEVDAQGDWASKETIRKAADRWMLEGRAELVDRDHSFQPVPAYVAESWLVRKGDPLFPREKEGAWAVGIQVRDEELWALIEAGEIEGLSLAGRAKVSKWLFWRKEGKVMDEKTIKALVKEALSEMEFEKRRQEEHERAIRKAAEEAQKPLREELETLKKAIASLNEALQKTDGRGATAGQPQSGEGETFV